MSRRMERLGLAALLCGGVLWWAALTRPANAFQAQVPAIGQATGETEPARSVPAPPAHRAEGIFDFRSANANEEKIQTALKDPQGVEIEFIDTPLKDAMDFLADAHRITILIDEAALTKEGIQVDEPISRTLSRIKLDSALKIMLEPLGLTHIIEDEVLKITSLKAANEKRITRVYNTGYLKQIGVEPDVLSKTIQAVIAPEHWRGNGAALEPASTGEKQAVVLRNSQGQIQVTSPALLQTVQGERTVAESKSNPPQSSIGVLGDMLVVSAPKAMHDKIQDLLVQLNRRWEQEHGQKK